MESLFRVKDGFLAGDLHMSFKSVFQDVRGSVDYVHMEVGFHSYHGFVNMGVGFDSVGFVHMDVGFDSDVRFVRMEIRFHQDGE